jgi:hypothetical protein
MRQQESRFLNEFVKPSSPLTALFTYPAAPFLELRVKLRSCASATRQEHC